jgi:hypothetical protein
MSLFKRRTVLLILALAIILLGIGIIGNLSVHRTNIVRTDPIGDVTDPDFDILQIKSFAESQHVVLELTVAGVIQTLDTVPFPNFLYRLIVVARGLETNAHIYACTYDGDVIHQYEFDFEIDNSTLRIFFPMTAFVHDSYMIGLEASAGTPLEEDFTPEDRDSPVSKLLFPAVDR